MIPSQNGWGHLLSLAVLAGCLAGPGTGQAETYPLDYRIHVSSASFSLPLDKAEVRFKQEPAYAGGPVVRSVLYLAPGQKEYIGFACDLKARKLYLDLNRNLDLTDDPAGVFESQADGYEREFKAMTIPVQQGDRRRELVVDMQIYGGNWGRYVVQSSWESGAVVLGGQTYWLAVVDNGDGAIDSEDTLFLGPAAPEGEPRDPDRQVELQAPSTLILNGAAYALAYEWSGDGRTLTLTVAPGASPLVEVALEGEGVERIVMQDGASAAVYTTPGGSVRMPAGHYRGRVRVKVGEGAEASLWEARNVSHRVRKEGGEPWRVGGPVVAKLTCQARGGRLDFDQAATGAGGETYSLAGSSGGALGKPKLRVKKDGEVIHVGNFEYG